LLCCCAVSLNTGAELLLILKSATPSEKDGEQTRRQPAELKIQVESITAER